MSPTPDPREAASKLRRLLASRGITDARVLDAVELTPREKFVDARHHDIAYEDRALSISAGQTISQPYVVARMTELLALTGDPGECVLEIGTGSGYQTAVLARLTSRVVTIERIPALFDRARRVLATVGIDNVESHLSDGSLGWPAAAPYDGIIVTAAAPNISPVLYDQLKIGGRLVVPVGTEENQVMNRVVKTADGPVVTEDFHCRFVPLIGQEGWQESKSG